MKKSRVFISSGQKKEELLFGNKLVEYFEKKGFETYFAEHVHVSKPLLQSILVAIKASEYFVAWNPSRDNTGEVGSLFVQQEIAIAASLNLPTLYFYAKGVDKIAGMSGALHLNGIEISDVNKFEEKLNRLTRKWDNTSKNQLYLKFGNEHNEFRVVNDPEQPLSTWYHIVVKNESSYKHTKNCRAYIDSIIQLEPRHELTSEYKQELIWAGTGMGTINITSKTKRDIDAVWTRKDRGLWTFQSVQTSTGYTYPTLQDGTYELVYLVVSDNMPDAKLKVKIKLESNKATILEQIQL